MFSGLGPLSVHPTLPRLPRTPQWQQLVGLVSVVSFPVSHTAVALSGCAVSCGGRSLECKEARCVLGTITLSLFPDGCSEYLSDCNTGSLSSIGRPCPGRALLLSIWYVRRGW